MSLGLDCAEGKHAPICSGMALCSEYYDGCRECRCACPCHGSVVDEEAR